MPQLSVPVCRKPSTADRVEVGHRMNKLMQKVSTIVVGSGNTVRTYRSAGEMPPAVQRKMDEALSGENSATLLIADERGRQEILKSLRGQETDLDSRLISALASRHKEQPARRRWRLSTRGWIEIGVLALIALVCAS